MEYKRTRGILLLIVACIVVVQPAVFVHAAAQYRVMIPAVATRPTPTPMPTPTPTPTPTPAPAERYTAMEREAVDKINERRRAVGCTPLVLNDQLSTAAERHSKDMATNNFFSHTGSDKSTAAQRITAAGYKWRKYGENLAVGYTTAADAVQGWYDSTTGHKEVMLDCRYKKTPGEPEFRDIGISVEISPTTQRYYWTTTFGVK